MTRKRSGNGDSQADLRLSCDLKEVLDRTGRELGAEAFIVSAA